MRLSSGEHRDLGADAGVARRRLDLEQLLLDLGHLELEQLHDELRRGARQDQLRAARLAVDLHHPGAHAVADAQVLLRDHLLARQQRLQAARLDDRAAALHALHRAGHQLVAARQEVVQDLLALGVADALQDHLLGGLRADAAELDVSSRLLDDVVELGVGLAASCASSTDSICARVPVGRVVGHHLPAAERLVVAGVAVDRDAHVDVLGVLLLGRRGERHLERAEDDVARHVLLARQHVHQHHQFAIPCRNFAQPLDSLTIPVPAAPARRRRAPARRSVRPPPASPAPPPRRAARRRTCAGRRRPGVRIRTSAFCPAKRAKSAALRSGRSSPGEDTSSRS